MKNKLITGLKVAGVCGLVGLTGFGLAGCGNQTSKVTSTPTQAYEAVESYDSFKARALDLFNVAVAKTLGNVNGVMYNVKMTGIDSRDNSEFITNTYLAEDNTFISTYYVAGKETLVNYGNLNEDEYNRYEKKYQDGEQIISTEVENKKPIFLALGNGLINTDGEIINVAINNVGNYVYDILETTSNGAGTGMFYQTVEITPEARLVSIIQSQLYVSNDHTIGYQNNTTMTIDYGVVKYADVKAMYEEAVAAFAQA